MKLRVMIVLLSSCLLLGACGAGNDKPEEAAGAEKGAQGCGTHDSIARPDWIPADLPLPADTEVIEVTEATSGFEGATLVFPGSTEDFREFIAAEWDDAGYTLTKSDHEESEAEGEFTNGEKEGWYKTVEDGCDTQSVMFLRYEA